MNNQGELGHGQNIALLSRVNIAMRRLSLAVLVAFSIGAPVFAAGPKASDKMPDKIDRALAGTLKDGTAKQKVIITVKPGYRATLRKALQQHGDKIKAEHGSLNVFVTELDTATVLELAKDTNIQALSLDGPMTASQLLPTVTVSPSTVLPGGTITVSVVNGPGNLLDWVALAPIGAPATTSVVWKYLGGGTSGTVQLVAPQSVAPGAYEVRFLQNDGFVVLATSSTVTVPSPIITTSASVVNPGGAFTVSVANGPGYAKDWIALSLVGSSATSSVVWKYIGGGSSATLNFVAPVTPGAYEARFLLNDGFVRLATSGPMYVQTLTPTVTPSATTVNPGSPITVTVANGPGNTTDWVSLSATSAADNSYLTWQYLNGVRTVPLTASTAATLTFVAPVTPGTYNFRFFADDGLTKLATSSAITVQLPPALTTLRQTLGLPPVATSTGFTSVGVAIIDSGISPSADFAGRITGFYDFTNGLNGAAVPPYDNYGHGTHVAGLIGSSGVLSNYEVQGVAPAVRLIGLKVLDGTGSGNTSDVIAALQFVTANKDLLNVQVVNMSLGHPIFAPAANDPLVQAVQQATAAGLVVVTSAGNFGRNPETGVVGYGGVTSPCNAPSAICVGAANTQNTVTRSDDVVAPYSSRGPSWYDGFAKPDVIAPGHKLPSDTDVTSFLYTNLVTSRGQAASGQPLLYLSGSSMSAAVASGVVALMIDAHNRIGFTPQLALTANTVKAMLEYSAIAIPGADYLTQGAGEINAAGAVTLAASIDTSQPVGSWWLTQAVTPSTIIGGQVDAWAQNIVWGATVVSGNVLYSNNIVWGNGIVWGANIVWGDSVPVLAVNIIWSSNIIWGENLVWGDRYLGQRIGGDNIVWGDNIIWGNNIVWAQLTAQNAVWGTKNGLDVIWGTTFGSNIVWGENTNIIWGSNIIWGQNIIWGNNIIWGQNIVWGENLTWAQSANSVGDTVWQQHDVDDSLNFGDHVAGGL